MPHSCSSVSHTNDRPKRSDAPRNSSITPQRKHRKLLKDGSGSEVWPEAVEKIFVDGLRRYWESPWATYSRGRSRWRNQFLVDYLHKAGIERSKKQVASHMQVLRNMWKGEPEFHLVAGGEELFSENGLLATVKDEEPCESRALATLSGEANDCPPQLSPSPPTPGYTPEFKLESPSHSPIQSSNPIFDAFSTSPFPDDSHRTHSPPQQDDRNVLISQPSVTRGSPPSTFPFERGSLKQPSSNDSSSPYSVDYQTHSLAPLATTSSPERRNPSLSHIAIPANPGRFFDQAPSPGMLRSPTNHDSAKLSSLCLWAEGMPPRNLSVDSLRTSSHRLLSPVSLHIKLSMPSMDDAHCLPALHGFHGTVTFNAHWPFSAKCVTKVFAEKVFISEEAENLHLVASSTTDGCQFTGFLPPESSLSRCRWVEPSFHHLDITQEFTLNDERLAIVHYGVDRKSMKGPPAAHLASFSVDGSLEGAVAPRTPTTPSIYPYSTSYNLAQPLPSNVSRYPGWRMEQALSCGGAPVNGMSPVMATPVLF